MTTECIASVIETSHEQQRSEADLNAQRDMAKWTFAMVVVSAAGTLIGVLGLLFIADTLRATRKGNKISREIGEAQARAYVGYLTAGLERPLGANAFTMNITIKNYGQTPAHKVDAWCVAERSVLPTKGRSDAQDTIENFTIPPTGELHLSAVHGPALVGGALVTDQNAWPPLISYGQITYEDAFKGRRFTNFRLRAMDNGYAPEPDGNDSN